VPGISSAARLAVVVHLVRFAGADECVPNTLLGVSFLDDPDRVVEIEAIALADTHVYRPGRPSERRLQLAFPWGRV
jgi:hypothetical protein